MTTENQQVPARPRGRFQMSAKRWLVVGLAAVVLAGAGVGTWYLLTPRGNAGNQTVSRNVEAALGTQTLTVGLDGTLSPSKQSNVNFGVAGTVTQVKVRAGQKVVKGQKLAVIDDSDLTDALALAEANLATARANLSDVYDNDGSSAAITSAKAQVSSASAAVTSARQDLNDAVLHSPIAGTVASVAVEEGDTVTGGGSSGSATDASAQFVVISTSTWKLTGSVGSADLASLKTGQPVTITTDAATDPLKGTVTSVGIVSTSTSDGAATFPVEIKVSGKHTNLYSGTTASAVITTGTYPDVLTVPTAAVRSEGGKTVVTKVTGASTSTVEVEVGKVFGTATEIRSGLAAGDTVQITFTRPSSTSTGGTNSGFGFGGPAGGGRPPGDEAVPNGQGGAAPASAGVPR